ncbi:TPA: Fic family protein [Streptococcus suis]
MNYTELRKIYYSDFDNYEKEYQHRLNGYSSLVTQLYPRLMKKDQFHTSRYPLFAVLHLGIQLLTQNIIETSDKIKTIAAQLPEVAHQQFYTEQMYQSIISTNEIEGIVTTRQELKEADRMVSVKARADKKTKHLSTLRMYKDILNDDFLHIEKLEDIRAIYDQLTSGEIDENDQLDGQLFRKEQVFVRDEQSGKAIHIPPVDEDHIERMLRDWIIFINSSQVPYLIKASLGHYFFENIHPFYDGNGRCGRYILAKYLARRLDKFSGLVVSQKINEYKNDYYKAFKTSGHYLNCADGTFFVHYLLKCILEGQEEILLTLQEKHSDLQDYQTKLDENQDLSDVEKYVIYLLAQSKLFVNEDDGLEDRDILAIASQSQHHFSQRSIKDSILKLEEKGILQVITKKPLRHILSDSF